MFRVSRRALSSIGRSLVVSDSVRSALNQGRGVVALESTVITHGLPYPHNLETARALEDEVRIGGSEPATIALLDGKVHIGLSPDELFRLAETMDAVKVSRRDIPYALVKGVVGGTTVAATSYLAHSAGIRVFATGGIGGVHRGAEHTFDISADLLELSRSPVVVVCAGAKSILDIPKTVEYLETHSVNTIVLSDRNIFPGFFSATTSSKAQMNTESLEEVADIVDMSASLGLSAGTLLACPIPSEFEADGQLIENAIQQALKEASEQGIRSQEMTPFLLRRVNELTKGASMKTNIALLRNNARIGGRLAKILAEKSRRPAHSVAETAKTEGKPKITVIGACILDFEAITNDDVKDDGGSYVGMVSQRCGGVGRNHADALARLGCDVTLLSAVGDDANGEYIMDRCQHIDLSRVARIPGVPSAVYMSMNVKGNVRYGVSSIGEIVDRISPAMISLNEDAIASSSFVVLDGNIPLGTMKRAADLAQRYNVPVWFEPTDIAKADKVFTNGVVTSLSAASPNANEFRMWAERSGIALPEEVLTCPQRLCDFIQSNESLFHNLRLLLVTLSIHGSAAIRRLDDGSLSAIAMRPPVSAELAVVSVSGAGDSLNSGIIAGMVHGLPWDRCLAIGQECAALTLATTEAVSREINESMLRPSERQKKVSQIYVR